MPGSVQGMPGKTQGLTKKNRGFLHGQVFSEPVVLKNHLYKRKELTCRADIDFCFYKKCIGFRSTCLHVHTQ